MDWARLGRLRSLKEMLELQASPFLGAVTQLRTLIVATDNVTDATEAVGAKDRDNLLRPHIEHLMQELSKLNARSALASANRLKLQLDNSSSAITYASVQATLLDIESRFADYLSDIRLFVLLEGDAGLMQPSDSLLAVPGRSIKGFSLAFPSASFEIEEAAKCLALGRYTASVFHSMRALESGIKALCALIEVPDATKPTEKNWGIILQTVREGMDKKWPRSKRLPGTMGAKLESLYATLDAVKNPWRNATMHVEMVYAPHEALHIARCTGMFFLELSSFCDEEGRQKDESPAMANVDDGQPSSREEPV